MFNYICGILVEKHPTVIVVDVNGMGYEICIPLSTFSQLPDMHETVRVLTHLQVREDAWTLFGFSSREEKELFRMLIAVSGIGPKVALTILSGIGVEKFNEAVVNKDSLALTAISGVGKKTAERIIVELKEKIDYPVLAGREVSQSKTVSFAEDEANDALTALLALGYKKPQAQEALKKVMASNTNGVFSVEELIRKSLTHV